MPFATLGGFSMDALELASEGASKSKGGLNMPDVRARVRESLPHHCQLTLTLSDSWQLACPCGARQLGAAHDMGHC